MDKPDDLKWCDRGDNRICSSVAKDIIDVKNVEKLSPTNASLCTLSVFFGPEISILPSGKVDI
jgi:hypothetical protein